LVRARVELFCLGVEGTLYSRYLQWPPVSLQVMQGPADGAKDLVRVADLLKIKGRKPLIGIKIWRRCTLTAGHYPTCEGDNYATEAQHAPTSGTHSKRGVMARWFIFHGV
jgi:hypothetical protein